MNKPEIEGDLLRIPYADKVGANHIMYTKELEYDMWHSNIGKNLCGLIVKNVTHDEKWIYVSFEVTMLGDVEALERFGIKVKEEQ